MRQDVFAALAAGLMVAGCAGQDPAPSRLAAPQTQTVPAAGTMTPQNQATLYLGLVDGLVKSKRPGAALAFLDSYAVAQKEQEPRYWLLRGNALLGLGRAQEAAQSFNRLFGTELAGEGWNGKGRVAALQRRWGMAVSDFGKAVKSQPANPDFLNNLAFASLHMGQKAQSLGYLRQARELDPKSELIRNNLLIALTLNGDRDSVAAMLAGIATEAERTKVRDLVQTAVTGGSWGDKS